jgi:hypothetical protein
VQLFVLVTFYGKTSNLPVLQISGDRTRWCTKKQWTAAVRLWVVDGGGCDGFGKAKMLISTNGSEWSVPNSKNDETEQSAAFDVVAWKQVQSVVLPFKQPLMSMVSIDGEVYRSCLMKEVKRKGGDSTPL